MSVGKDLNEVRSRISWIYEYRDENEWREASYQTKTEMLMEDLINEAARIGYISPQEYSFQLRRICLNMVKQKHVLFDIGDSLMPLFLYNVIPGHKSYTIISIAKSNKLVITDRRRQYDTFEYDYLDDTFRREKKTSNALDITYKGNSLINDIDKKYQVTNVYAPSLRGEGKDAAKYDKKLLEALVEYFRITSTEEYRFADQETRTMIINDEAKLFIERSKPLFRWRDLVSLTYPHTYIYPNWFYTGRNPRSWNEAIGQINEQLLDHLVNKLPSNIDKDRLKATVEELLATGNYLLSQKVYSLLPYFVYIKTGRLIPVIEIKNGAITISRYNPMTLKRYYRQYSPYSPIYVQGTIPWDDDLFRSLLEFYSLEDNPQYNNKSYEEQKEILDSTLIKRT